MTKKVLLVLISILFIFSCKEDYKKPTITLRGDLIVELYVGQKYVEQGYIAYDTIDGDVTNRVFWEDNIDTLVPGVYSIKYYVENSYGVKSQDAYRTVRVQLDKGKIELKGDSNIELKLGSTEYFIDPGIVATDVNGSSALSKVNVTNNIDYSAPGKYSITYSFTDEKGYFHSVKRNVFLVLPDEPIIVLKGAGQNTKNPFRIQYDIQGNAKIASVEPGYRAFYKPDGEITHLVKVDYTMYKLGEEENDANKVVLPINNSNNIPVEVCYATYTVTTKDDKSFTTKRYIKILQDGTPPSWIMYKPNLEIINVGTPWTINYRADVKVTDNGLDYSDNVIVTVNLIENLETNKIISANVSTAEIYKDAGLYEIIYSATDDSGNSSFVKRYVQAVDNDKPVVTFRGEEITEPVVVYQEVEYAADKSKIYADPIATDNAKSFVMTVSGDVYSSINTRKVGLYTTTFYSVDPSKNEGHSVKRLVYVLPPTNAPVQNAGFDDFIPDVGKEDEDGNLIGWQWAMRAFLREGTYSGWTGTKTTHKIIDCIDSDEEYGGANVCEVVDRFSQNGLGCAFTTGLVETSPLIKVPNTAIPMNFANYIVRSMGTLSQTGVKVYKDVEYQASFWFRYYGNNSLHQDLTWTIYAEKANLKLNGQDKVSKFFASNQFARQTWHKAELAFKPNMDGTIKIEFYKGDIVGGYSDGCELDFDSVEIKPISYPVK